MSESQNSSDCPFIVGLGASAGGLEPLEDFFDALPNGSGAAFVVIQHLSPDFRSLMKELLDRHTVMTVHRVEDEMQVEPDSIYLIPPKKSMRLEGGRLRLYDLGNRASRTPNFAIDEFFESLASEAGNRAVAVVLSGSGTDGARGVRAVNEHGGFVFVQEPSTTQFDGMPASAIATGSVHSVLPPTEIATAVFQLVTQFEARGVDEAVLPGVSDRSVLLQISALLRMEEDIDFSHYRPGTVARRISRRMTMTQCTSVCDYVERLTVSPKERRALRDDLLIGVTSFFRDDPAWEALYSEVILPLVQADSQEAIRVWVTACSSGEEVYSLAILLLEAVRETNTNREIKVFGTDIDRRALETAALGVYPTSVLDEIGSERVARYFKHEHESLRVDHRVRELVIFAEHNLTRDAAFTNIDLVTCRNALIYMEPSLQRSVISMLHFSLKVEGVLFLGSSETLGDLSCEFSVVDSSWNLYRKRRAVRLATFDGLRRGPLLSPVLPRVSRVQEAVARTPVTVDDIPDPFKRALRVLLYQRSATCLIVDSNRQLVHAVGPVSKFVRVPEGSGTQDILRMVDENLGSSIGTALHRAGQVEEPVSFTGVALQEDPSCQVDLVVSALEGAENERMFVVLIEEAGVERPEAPFTVDEHVAAQIEDLERNLNDTRANLQATIEQLETTNEENQSTNEELLASNEELQSTNEELQSVNEELFTVNSEHQSKIQELTDLYNDMDNLLLSSLYGSLFLDDQLRVRKFTPMFLDVVQLSESDVGRPITDFSNKTDIPDLWEKFGSVAETGEELEWRFEASDKQGFLRCVPYRTLGSQNAGIVATYFSLELIQRAMNAPRDGAERKQSNQRRRPESPGASLREAEGEV